MTVLSALLLTAAVVGAAVAARVHGALREGLRELRESERRLEPGAGPGRRLSDELRWYGDVAGAVRDTGWPLAAAVVGLFAAGGLVVGVWTLTSADALGVASVLVLLAGFALVLGLLVADGRRAEARLGTAARHSALGPVRRLESALAAVHAASARVRTRHRAWLRARAATYPLAPAAVPARRRAYDRAVRRQDRALAGLRRAVPVDLSAVAVRLPDGYAEGLRGLAGLVGGGVADDDRWAAAVADLGRAAELDGPRRTRWLSALAACAELRDDPPARESAARWALDAAALGEPSVSPGDPLPDTVAIEPARPVTWEGALRRARTVGAAPALLAEVTLRWAYALVAGRSPLDPAVAAAVDLTAGLDRPDADRYLTPVRAGLTLLGATGDQLSRLVPPWTPPPAPDSPAVAVTRTRPDPVGGRSPLPTAPTDRPETIPVAPTRTRAGATAAATPAPAAPGPAAPGPAAPGPAAPGPAAPRPAAPRPAAAPGPAAAGSRDAGPSVARAASPTRTGATAAAPAAPSTGAGAMAVPDATDKGPEPAGATAVDVPTPRSGADQA